jgi:hypothetical protein
VAIAKLYTGRHNVFTYLDLPVQCCVPVCTPAPTWILQAARLLVFVFASVVFMLLGHMPVRCNGREKLCIIEKLKPLGVICIF